MPGPPAGGVRLRGGLRLAEDPQGHLHAAADQGEGRGDLPLAGVEPAGERGLVRESLAEAGGENGAEALGEPAYHGVLPLEGLAVGVRARRESAGHRRDAAARQEAERLAGDPISKGAAGLPVHQRVEIKDGAHSSVCLGRMRSAAQRRAERRR